MSISSIVVLFYLVQSMLSDDIGYSTQSFCLDELPTSQLQLECREHHLIKLGRIVYGFSWSNDCSYIDKDCTMDVPRDDIVCHSPSNCTVRVFAHPLILQSCWNLPASYVQAEFECIEDYVLQNVCQKQETELAQGFLSSPSYPLGSLSNNHCQCQLVPSSNHLIALEIIDFRLPPCSEAGLYLSIAEDHRPKCSNQNPITLLANYQQNVTLRFYTVSNFTQGGFLLKYSTLPLNSNGTIRLECHAIQALSRSLLTKYQITKSSASPLTEPILDLEQLEALMFSSTVNTDVNNSIHQSLKSLQQDSRTTAEQLLYVNGQNQSGKNSSRENSSISLTTMALLVLCITASLIFCLIIVNFLTWMFCSTRSFTPRKDASHQNLYSRPTTLQFDKVRRKNRSASPPVTGNRLKTLHSLLYFDRRVNPSESATKLSSEQLQSNRSEWEQTFSRNPETNVDRTITLCSSSLNLTHGFFVKSKFDSNLQPIDQVTSWDDV